MTLQEIREIANQKLAWFWTNVIVPKQEAYYLAHGRYAQCLYTQNIPKNTSQDTSVKELIPVSNIAPSDHPGVTSEFVLGGTNIKTKFPFALAIYSYSGPFGKGFIAQVWLKFSGTIYTRAKAYGPEEANFTFGWRSEEENITTQLQKIEEVIIKDKKKEG